MVIPDELNAFADPQDYEVCRRIQQRYATTYYFATTRFAQKYRRRIHALYGFVRVPDEWVDNPNGMSPKLAMGRLREWRHEMLRGLDGVRPHHPVMRAFCDVVREAGIPVEEPLCFLDAMEMDLEVTRYPTYEDLRRYMRGSASAVGMIMCYALDAGEDPVMLYAARALGEAMQLTNFLRDIGEDLDRGRIYLPLEDLDRFSVREEEILERRVTHRFRTLMEFEISRARALYCEAAPGIPLLPRHAQKGVRLALELYSRILNRIEHRGYDVFTGRARTGPLEKLAVAARVLVSAW